MCVTGVPHTSAASAPQGPTIISLSSQITSAFCCHGLGGLLRFCVRRLDGSAPWSAQVFRVTLDLLVDFEASLGERGAGGLRRDILSRSFSSELGRPLTASIFIVPCLDQRDGSLQNKVWWVSLVPTPLSLKAGSVSSKTDVWFLEYTRRIVQKDYGWKI